MNTFLKVLVTAALVVVALHVLPALVGLGLGLGAILLAIVGIGVGVIAALLAAGVGLAVALSPIWLPVLAIVGLIALCKKAAKTV